MRRSLRFLVPLGLSLFMAAAFAVVNSNGPPTTETVGTMQEVIDDARDRATAQATAAPAIYWTNSEVAQCAPGARSESGYIMVAPDSAASEPVAVLMHKAPVDAEPLRATQNRLNC